MSRRQPPQEPAPRRDAQPTTAPSPLGQGSVSAAGRAFGLLVCRAAAAAPSGEARVALGRAVAAHLSGKPAPPLLATPLAAHRAAQLRLASTDPPPPDPGRSSRGRGPRRGHRVGSPRGPAGREEWTATWRPSWAAADRGPLPARRSGQDAAARRPTSGGRMTTGLSDPRTRRSRRRVPGRRRPSGPRPRRVKKRLGRLAPGAGRRPAGRAAGLRGRGRPDRLGRPWHPRGGSSMLVAGSSPGRGRPAPPAPWLRHRRPPRPHRVGGHRDGLRAEVRRHPRQPPGHLGGGREGLRASTTAAGRGVRGAGAGISGAAGEARHPDRRPGRPLAAAPAGPAPAESEPPRDGPAVDPAATQEFDVARERPCGRGKAGAGWSWTRAIPWKRGGVQHGRLIEPVEEARRRSPAGGRGPVAAGGPAPEPATTRGRRLGPRSPARSGPPGRGSPRR